MRASLYNRNALDYNTASKRFPAISSRAGSARLQPDSFNAEEIARQDVKVQLSAV